MAEAKTDHGSSISPAATHDQFGSRAATVVCASTDGSRRHEAETRVIEEEILTIDVADVGRYALMWTPTTDHTEAVAYCIEDGILAASGIPEQLAIATGFAFTEGIINHLAEITQMSVCPERPDVVNMRLKHPEQVSARRRNVVMTSSCGVCGAWEQLAASVSRCAPVSTGLRATVADLMRISNEMQQQQRIFDATGGAHAAAIFDADLKVVAVAEDLGRHNALDKVIGYRLLGGAELTGCGAFISSRISFEMAAKAARAGCEILAAISAPTSLAIEMAERSGITLCGFVRRGSAEIYSHPQRIVAA
ncbi:MAG: formate dehydrogenase accessory sulfurtransferase FdhD [Azonexus sp.]|jgi:FdhD protein|nr:formate dehydrogenase accessory sulfurtransferase FdhD [Azonexus sp.]